jgi:cyclopropane-fatty-acyl-phospholipid synthase
MIIEAQVEKAIDGLRAHGLPLAIELWNGKRYQLSGETPVTLRIPGAGALKYFIGADLAKLGEAYVEGHIDVEGPIREVLRAAEGLSRFLGGDKKGRRPRLLNLHTRARDASAIQYHYDVSNEFYALFLDREMVYSCAYYKTGDEDIHAAQAQKLDHICRKLRLEPGDRFLDIGCGWGALVRWAAKHYGVDATGITLSRNQHKLANERIAAEGLSERCRVLLQDYRDVPGEAVFDKISSVGMFEHVGLGGGEFIGKYVFPHGELPHLSLALREMAAAGLEVMDVETLRLHYARTLWQWSARLEANLEAARRHTEEKRVRIWRTYLAGCAHAFEKRWVTIQQVVVTKTGDPRANQLPWTREHLYRTSR